MPQAAPLAQARTNYTEKPSAKTATALSKALFSAHLDAIKTEDTQTANSLLDDLRAQANSHDEALIQEPLAKALLNAQASAVGAGDTETANTLLNELRTLANNHDEAPIQEQLAKALSNAHLDARKTGDNETANTLLDELRALANSRNEAPIREGLANALLGAQATAVKAGDSKTAKVLLNELRALANNHDEAPIRTQLVNALFNAHLDARNAGETETANTLLSELRDLANSHNETPIREGLAKVLFNAHFDARKAGETETANTLLSELRDLAHKYNDEAPIRERLANALFNTHSDAGNAGDTKTTNTLLDELRALANSHNEAPIREQLAKALFNTHSDAGNAEDSKTANPLLDELRALANSHDEAPIRERLANALFNAHLDARKAGDSKTAKALLNELRAQAKNHNEAPIREPLAGALFNAHLDARKAGDSKTAKALLNELRTLAKNHNEAPIRERLAKALVNAHIDAKEARDSKAAKALLNELRALANSHDEAPIRKRLAYTFFNAHLDAVAASKTQTANDLRDELRTLAQAHPGESSLRATLYEALDYAAYREEQKAKSNRELVDTLNAEAKNVLHTLNGNDIEALQPRDQYRFKLRHVIEKFSGVRENFIEKMEQRELRTTAFLEATSRFQPDTSLVFILRQWNSYTPIIVENEESDRGGGYFIYHHTTDSSAPLGLVIDPGYNFIEHFHKACCRIHDITHIAITHAHDDHTAQLEQLFTLLHQYNRRRKADKQPPKKVTMLLNHSVSRKFSGFDLYKGAGYIEKVVSLNAFDPKNIQRITMRSDCFLTVLPAYHNDVLSRDYAIGLGLEIGQRKIVFTGDTGLFPPLLDEHGNMQRYETGEGKGEDMVNERERNEVCSLYPAVFRPADTQGHEYDTKIGIHSPMQEADTESSPQTATTEQTGATKVRGTVDLLIPHIGSIKKYEFSPRSRKVTPMFYPNHLGLLGTAMLIQKLAPQAVIVSEFGAELRDIRAQIVQILKEAITSKGQSEGAPYLFPGDPTLVYNIKDATLLCHGDGKFYAPQDLEFKEVDGGNIGLFRKGTPSATLKPYFEALDRQRQKTDNSRPALELPYFQKPPATHQ